MESKKKILIIDDDQSLRSLLVEILSSYECLTAKDGEQGIKEARSKKFDLIITDFEMPGRTGIDVVREIRKNSKNRETPVIITSGYPDINLNELFQAGAQDFLPKPWELADLRQKVEKWIGD